MRRLLSCAVQIRPAPSQAQILTGMAATASMPSESETRDAIAKVTRELEDMRIARGEGWTATDEYTFTPFVTPEGEVGLRGALIIERRD